MVPSSWNGSVLYQRALMVLPSVRPGADVQLLAVPQL